MAFKPKSHTFLRGDLEGILKGLSRTGRRKQLSRSAYEHGFQDALVSLAESLNIEIDEKPATKRRGRR